LLLPQAPKTLHASSGYQYQ